MEACEWFDAIEKSLSLQHNAQDHQWRAAYDFAKDPNFANYIALDHANEAMIGANLLYMIGKPATYLAELASDLASFA